MKTNITAILAALIFATIGRADPLDTWSAHSSVPTLPSGLASLAYGGGQYVAVGDFYPQTPGPLIMTSSNTINWVQRQGPTNLANDLYFNNITGSRIAYGNGQFVAVGWGYNEQALVVISSTDGANWVQRFVGPRAAPIFFGANAYSIVYGNGRFAVVPYTWNTGQGGVGAISDDGVSWTSVQSGINGVFEAVTYGHGQFVAVGAYGAVATSPNGVNWTQGQTGTADWLEQVVYGNGRYVAWGFQTTNSPVNTPVLMTSLDGVNWTERLWTNNGGFHINGIAFGQGRFVAVSGLKVFSSTDGVNWTVGATNTNEVYLVAYGDSRFVAEGASGTILESGPFISVALMPGSGTGLFTLSLTGPTGLAYTVQSSTNLISWQTVTNFTSIQPNTTILDAIYPSGNRIFYRAVSP